MRFTRPLLAMVAAAILFAVYTWDVNRVERDTLRGIQQQQVLFQNPANAVALEFRDASGVLRLEREGVEGSWHIVEPVETRANDTVVNAYLENLRGARRQARFDDRDRGRYGLDEPRREVALTLRQEDGESTRVLIFGNQPAEFGNVYAAIEGEPEVFTVSEWFFRQSNMTLNDIRDRSLARGTFSKARVIRIENRRDSFEIVRRDETATDWRVFAGTGMPVPADRVILDRLQASMLEGAFIRIDDNPTSTTQELGLDDPTLRLFADGEEVIRVGRPVPDRELFHARTADGRIGIVSAAFFTDFFRSPIEWGTKRLIWIPREDIQQIITRSAGAGMALLREDTGWIFADAPDLEIRPDRVNAFVEAVVTVSAMRLEKTNVTREDWIDYGILEESYAVQVQSSEGLVQGFRFGRTDSRNGYTYVLREQDSSVWQLDFRSQGRVFRFRHDLEERRLIPDLVDKVNRFEVEVEGNRFVMEKAGREWRVTLPGERPAFLPESQVYPLFRAFQEMEVEAELLSADHRAPETLFRVYTAGDPEPIWEGGVVARAANSVLIDTGSRKLQVSLEQFGPFDDELAQLLLLSKAQMERGRQR